MVKRKQASNSELRSSQIPITVHKYDLSNLRSSAKQYWNVDNIQPYFPPIQKLFKTSDLEHVTEYGIKLDEEVLNVLEADKIRTTLGNAEIHTKVAMILSPYKFMRGEYGGTLGLPTSSEQSSAVFEKLQNPNNASYVGATISAILSQTGCQHFPKVYGIFNGISAEHTIDISDDYGELADRPWFSHNIGKTFDIKLSNDIISNDFKHTRTSRIAIRLGDEMDLGNVEEIEPIPVDDVVMGDLSRVLHDDQEDDDGESDSSSVSTSYIFEVRSCDCDDESEMDEEDESCEPFAWATFKNVPVQITVMEKCEGTIYELMMMNFDNDKHLAWITQLMFAIAYAQRCIGLTHNDLHANNVMYTKTDKEFFYYNSGGVLYKVPTYGYLIKIIDFERGIASIKITGLKEPKLFMSDHFHIDEEAGGQYNYGDYYHSKYPEMKPNPSFDLCRFATSMFWDLFSEGPDHPDYKNLILFQLFMKWLTIDGKSILFSQDDEAHDRYHGFHLYKAIARYCKDNAIPRKEVLAVKGIYEVSSVPEGNTVLLLD